MRSDGNLINHDDSVKATPAVTKGATNIKEKTPSEAIPDHFQNRAVRHAINQPPNVANKTK
jgi:hypothetical protein